MKFHYCENEKSKGESFNLILTTHERELLRGNSKSDPPIPYPPIKIDERSELICVAKVI